MTDAAIVRKLFFVTLSLIKKTTERSSWLKSWYFFKRGKYYDMIFFFLHFPRHNQLLVSTDIFVLQTHCEPAALITLTSTLGKHHWLELWQFPSWCCCNLMIKTVSYNHFVCGLPGYSDPYCMLGILLGQSPRETEEKKERKFSFRKRREKLEKRSSTKEVLPARCIQVTEVKPETLNPVWNEHFLLWVKCFNLFQSGEHVDMCEMKNSQFHLFHTNSQSCLLHDRHSTLSSLWKE